MQMRHTALLLAGLLLVVGSAAAHAGHSEHADTSTDVSVSAVLESPEEFADAYNRRAEQLPSLAKTLVSGERIDIHVETGDGETVIGVVMDGAKIDTVERGGVDDPTVEILTDAATLETILASENPGKRALSAFNGDGIRYRAHGLGSSVKFAVLSAVSAVLQALL